VIGDRKGKEGKSYASSKAWQNTTNKISVKSGLAEEDPKEDTSIQFLYPAAFGSIGEELNLMLCAREKTSETKVRDLKHLWVDRPIQYAYLHRHNASNRKSGELKGQRSVDVHTALGK